MAKKKFYALCRYKDKTDGIMKAGYLLKEGFNVPNTFGFDLAVYRANEYSVDSVWKIWFVVDTRTGMSIAHGDTKRQAIKTALERVESIDMDKYRAAVSDAEEMYGPCPGHSITYMWGKA